MISICNETTGSTTFISIRFPEWTQGYWEDMFIQGHTMVFQVNIYIHRYYA